MHLVLRELYGTQLFGELDECPGLLWFRPKGPMTQAGERCDFHRLFFWHPNLKGLLLGPILIPVFGWEWCFQLQVEAPGPNVFYDPNWPEHLPEVAGAIVGLAVAWF